MTSPLLLWAVALTGALGTTPPQTVVPPGSVPGAQTVVTPDMRNAGSPRGSKEDDIAPGMSRQDRKQLRKMAKVKSPSSQRKASKKL